VPIDVVELGHVETRRGAADGVEIEPFDGLRRVDDFVVAVRPTQAEKVIAHGLRQIAHIAIGFDAHGAVTFRELRAVGAMDQRNMGEPRQRPVHRAVDLDLPERIGQMIDAADDVRYSHVVIVDDDGMHVGRRSVRAQEHHVVELSVSLTDLALHEVLDDGLAALRRLQSDYGRHARWRLGRIAVAPAAVIALRKPLRSLLLAHGLQLLGCAVAVVGLALGQELARHFGVTRSAGELKDDLVVPIEAEPFETGDDGVDGGLRGALPIRILDAQAEDALVVTRIQPIEQGRPRPADMQEAGRRGGEANDNGHESQR
jgi:hypothetical protein